ncbi:uncharacterized protein LOC129291433 isoform X2 [Prosopis cineraria]|uniref:uncharacterized protein LOC129291433 isoform X2 n=1 Tax=Prosopis cineraria TaxID=364024 RepID=UPI00240F25D8|nr:uncharacterized protein LOC129291433 isoform X2 [Prosopis cineraria]XP_054784747.1 uncharacterized protein LOC129291433 isoform X2 [Prosopis cineraria]XP_054784748.1 uncharacterized protein LOC129291433 isoform X2 [Prosopis cineraria]XP_054784749.1 uncharacterized protein LOC129291433 isoform X2 [Prosopis cineraria]XP_054784750.1 uncharacterized protein LOC129291433 isoform X2 [Prosopis cineraria]XP_054784751.1 uncharacterized protein LOC129291433 isoform X2 [Prosopis cineraria]
MSVFAKFRAEMEEAASLQSSTVKMLRAISERARDSGQQIIFLSIEGIRVAQAHKGFLLCNFKVPNGVSDENENWHPGAIATLIDNIGTLATFSLVPAFNVSVDFSISFFSTAKVQEEVEVEAKVVGKKERLTCVAVQVRKKANGELIASGKQWMAATNVIAGLRTICRMKMESVMQEQSLL